MSEVILALLLVQASKQVPAAEQPIPFSHKAHAGTLKLKCKMCHPNAGSGETMQIAKAPACMQCHSAIKTDSPAVQKLAAFAKDSREIRWARVYEIPSYVNFSHKTHLDTGNTCEDCHGPVVERDRLFREGDISMGGCMNCHRLKKVSIDCTFCHDER
jgi:hypothetical protein